MRLLMAHAFVLASSHPASALRSPSIPHHFFPRTTFPVSDPASPPPTATFAARPPNAANPDVERPLSQFWRARTKCWRPTVSDVERISWGKPAKKKGTGSRGVPHRLNNEERDAFDRARRKGFLEVAGSGWRSQRRDAPMLNSYRSLCDARGQVCIVLHKGKTGSDALVVDLSPLRVPEDFEGVAESCVRLVSSTPISMGNDFEGGSLEDLENEEIPELGSDDHAGLDDGANSEDDLWESRPIYQLSPYCISWELPRSDAKSLAKDLAALFQTAEPKVSKSRKPKGVKHGKGRRHGGYGIG